MKNKKDSIENILETCFSILAKTQRHRYLKDEMWRKLPNRKHADTAEVNAAFLTNALYYNNRVLTTPCGMAWTTIWNAENEDNVKEYLDEYKDIFDDYIKWCDSQR